MSLSHVFLLFCFCVPIFQLDFKFAASNPSGLTLRAFIDDSPSSPLYRIENLTRTERIERLINVTHARANYLNLVSNPNATVLPDNIRIPISREGLFYAVKFTMGSQQFQVKLLMDTAGGLTWTQCQPCQQCFPQTLPIFNPRDSTTYRILPCNHPLCQGAGKPFTCVGGRACAYTSRYGGGASTRGIASLETFQFPTGSFNNIIFGCSIESLNVAFENTDISGIFGLSLSPESMTTQFSPSKFSYCLVPFGDAIPRPLVLTFGEDVPRLPPQQSQITAFATIPGIPYFYLQLMDITVADHRIGFPPNTFQVRPNRFGGCFIDSGALYTIIDTDTPGVNAYRAVLHVFAAYYGSRGLTRTRGSFDLCYQLPEHYNDYASLTFHFNGADYTVEGQYVNEFKTGSFCVAILGKNFGSVLGAWQQQNKRIIYDLGMNGLQFADEQCINGVP